jgi:hypothetical protein
LGTAVARDAFDQQVGTLVRLGYPGLFGMGSAAFVASLAPLADLVPPLDDEVDAAGGTVPFVIVVDAVGSHAAATLPLIVRRGQAAIERLYPRSASDFVTIPATVLPAGNAYLLIDVERGAASRNVTPDAAYDLLEGAGRSPLTIAEGIALLTHHPEFLQPNHGFSLLASRCGDKRVPAFWLSEGRPKLGWCWGGNPHTWLGSASCARRGPG